MQIYSVSGQKFVMSRYKIEWILLILKYHACHYGFFFRSEQKIAMKQLEKEIDNLQSKLVSMETIEAREVRIVGWN